VNGVPLDSDVNAVQESYAGFEGSHRLIHSAVETNPHWSTMNREKLFQAHMYLICTAAGIST
jgi:hypothetical protein